MWMNQLKFTELGGSEEQCDNDKTTVLSLHDCWYQVVLVQRNDAFIMETCSHQVCNCCLS